MSALVWLGVALLGGTGAVARYVVDAAVSARAGTELPWGTFAVNASGAFALGVIAGAAVGGDALLLAGGGLLGSYTTFSTWMLETDRLDSDGHRRAAALNVAGSLAVGLAGAELGRLLGGL